MSQNPWGKQTALSIHFFNIGEQFPLRGIITLIQLKKYCAQVNYLQKKLSKPQAQAIIKSCDFLLKDPNLTNYFPLKVYQTGSGTQSHMNVNEVISHIAKKHFKTTVHPNDHVNLGQSSNDMIPTMMNIALSEEWLNLDDALKAISKTLKNKSHKFKTIVKLGRTHMMDATPITLGQEFSAYHHQISEQLKSLTVLSKQMKNLALGGTAVGTGLNSSPKFTREVVKLLNKNSKQKFKSAANKFSALSSHHDIVSFSGGLSSLAASLFKMANDLRLLSSGPRGGLGELILPANEPGSSIMPGKINPTQIEALSMVCCQVIGLHQSITIAETHGHLQLNAFKPLIFNNTLQSLNLLTAAINSFNNYCLKGLKPNLKNINKHLQSSLMAATALNPILGYDVVAEAVKYALENDLTLKEVLVSHKQLLSEKEFDKLIDYKKMT